MRDLAGILAVLPGTEAAGGRVTLPAGRVVEALRALKALGGFVLFDISAVDGPEGFELSWRLLDLKEGGKEVLTLVAVAERDDPVVPSAIGVWKSADVLEREVWDLMGVRFSGRDGLGRILTADDFEGHPLRKDFVAPRRERFPEESWAKKAAEGGR